MSDANAGDREGDRRDEDDPDRRSDGGAATANAGDATDSAAEAADGAEDGVPPERPTIARALWGAVRALQLFLLVLAGYTLFFSESSVFNVVVPLGLAFLPDAVARATAWRMNPVLSAWIATSATLHALGALGAYTEVPGFDWFAHAVSAALVAGVGYALVRAIDEGREDVELPGNIRFLFVFVFAMAFGGFWELAEFLLTRLGEVTGTDPLLTQYGLLDAAGDLTFNAVGAILVALWGTRFFDGIRAAMATTVGEDGAPDDVGASGTDDD